MTKKEKAAAYQRAYRRANLEKIRAADRARDKAKPERQAATRVWQKTHREKRAATERKSKYGLEARAFADMLASQGGVCAICCGVNPSGESLCVDHDHITGKIRGLLCRACNAALGLFGDQKTTLIQAIKYLDGGAYP